MNRILRTCFTLLAAGLAIVAAPLPARALDNLFFLHHSTGLNLLSQGHVRQLVTDYNTQHGTHFVLWDHDYNAIGLTDPLGLKVARCYNIPNDNTDPVGLYQLWTTANSARDSILTNHQVIAFKSCYPASAITTAALLAQYKTWYLAIRNVLDQHPEKTFLVMSPPPLHRLVTDLTQADNARAFANWLKSAEFLQGHPNIACYDLFDALAAADTPGASTRNMLKYEYEISHTVSDSHANAVANLAVAPLFVSALLDAATGSLTDVPGTSPVARALAASAYPNPFNPRTTIRFDLQSAGPVRLSVYDVAGRLVRTLVDSDLAGGTQEVAWDGRDASGRGVGSGSYFARLLAAGRRETVWMSLVR